MATFNFDGSSSSSVNFNSETDTLNIIGIAAAVIEIDVTGSDLVFTDPDTGESITLNNTNLKELTTSNIVFDDGSMLVVGDNDTGTQGDKFGNDIDLSTSTADNQIFGLHGDDTILSGSGDDILRGGQGDDFIDAGGGNDLIKGGKDQGSDTLFGGSGDDTLSGGQKTDYLDGGDGHDLMEGGQGKDTLLGGSGDDTLTGGQGQDSMDGGGGNDLLIGGQARDTMDGGSGDDFLKGGQARDTMYGGTGDDVLKGGQGRDYLEGGSGADTISGGAGADSFVFNAPADGVDIITDFDHATGDEVAGDQLLFNGGNNTSQFQWGYQSTAATRANTIGTLTSDFFLSASNKTSLLSAISNAAGSLFGSTIGTGLSSVGYFFGYTSNDGGLFYIVANQHTQTGSVVTTYNTYTLAGLEGITNAGAGANQISHSDIILF